MAEEKKCDDELPSIHNEKIPLLLKDGKKSYHGGDGETKSQKLYSPLIEASRHLQKANGSISGDEVARAILPLFPTFLSALPLQHNAIQTNNRHDDLNFYTVSQPNEGISAVRAAVASIDGRQPISHQMIYSFVEDFGPKLHEWGYGRSDRIALVLPNGPELALAILCTVHWASCVPLNVFGAHTELVSDLKACGADLVIGPYSPGNSSYQHVQDIARELDLPFVGLVQSKSNCGIFTLQVPPGNELLFQKHSKPRRHLKNSHSPNGHDDEVMVLFTSGTTGSKKLVSHLLGEMLVATAIN